LDAVAAQSNNRLRERCRGFNAFGTGPLCFSGKCVAGAVVVPVPLVVKPEPPVGEALGADFLLPPAGALLPAEPLLPELLPAPVLPAAVLPAELVPSVFGLGFATDGRAAVVGSVSCGANFARFSAV
jgi:hypothetical protein